MFRTKLFPVDTIGNRPESITVAYRFAIKFLDQSALGDLRVLAWLPSGVASQDLQNVLPNGEVADLTLYSAGVAYRKASRLKMLKPLQNYVAREHPSSTQERQRAREHYLGLAVLGNDLGRQSDSETLVRLGIEYANFPPALQDAFDGSDREAIDAACGLGRFSARTGVGRTESREWVVRGRFLAEELGDKTREAKCLTVLGNFDFVSGGYEQAKSSYRQALEIYCKMKDMKGEANCLWQLGTISRKQKDYGAAEDFYNGAISLYRELRDKEGEAWCEVGFGDLAFDSLCRKLRDKEGEAWWIVGFGDLAFDPNEFEKTWASYNSARSCFQAAQHKRGEAGCLWNLADLARLTNDLSEAEKLFRESLELFREIADKGGEAWCLKGLGDVAYLQNVAERAEASYNQALPVFRSAEEKHGEAECLESFAYIVLKKGKIAQARSLRVQARDVYLARGEIVSVERIQSLLDAD